MCVELQFGGKKSDMEYYTEKFGYWIQIYNGLSFPNFISLLLLLFFVTNATYENSMETMAREVVKLNNPQN